MIEIIQKLFEGLTLGPFVHLMEIFTLGAGNLLIAFGIITVLFFINELLKAYLMIEHTHCIITHVGINIMTILPAIILMAILIYAGFKHPERTGINFTFVVLSFIPWYLAGKFTRLARRDTEGADIGFMTVGLLLVVFAGIITTLVF